MPDYALDNYDNVKDFAADRDGIDARFSRSALECTQVGVSRFTFDPGFRTPFGHHHDIQEEVYAIVAGSGRVRLDDEIVDLKLWDVVRVAPEVVRAFEAGPDGLTVIAVGGNRPEDGDGHMVQDFWTD